MEFENILSDYNIYKQLILNNKTEGRHIIVETKSGEQGIVLTKYKKWERPFIFEFKDIERITFFIDDKEYEFVACQ